jgi:vacuolar-type H+-ATPase subunit H
VAKQGSEDLAAQIAERVREALAEAEKRAEHIVTEAQRNAHESVSEAEGRAREIVAEAEREAKRIRAETEKAARERVERARAALDELGQALNPASTAPASEPAPAAPEEAPAEATPEPVAAEPEPEPEEPEPEPESPEPAAGGPSTDELIAQLRGGDAEAAGEAAGGREKGDAGAARLVAMNMALEGASREEVGKRLAEDFDVDDRDALVEDVFSRVGK